MTSKGSGIERNQGRAALRNGLRSLESRNPRLTDNLKHQSLGIYFDAQVGSQPRQYRSGEPTSQYLYSSRHSFPTLWFEELANHRDTKQAMGLYLGLLHR